VNKKIKVAIALTVAAVVAFVVTGCGSSNSKPGNTAKNIGDLQAQQQQLTLDAWNAVQTNPAYKYVAPKNPLELANLKERLARFNDPSKLGYMYTFVAGTNIVFFSTVKGKVSSNDSSMTSPVGIVKDQGTGGGGNLTVPMPGDDLSFGSEECGAQGVFWFDAQNVIHEWCASSGPWMYLDAPINLPASVIQLTMPDGSKPSNTGSTVKP
jgi:outer membrane murein-binding lipoprotein Lpp